MESATVTEVVSLASVHGAHFSQFRCGQEAVVHTSEAFTADWAGIVL